MAVHCSRATHRHHITLLYNSHAAEGMLYVWSTVNTQDRLAAGGVILTLRTAKLPFAYLDNLELDVADWLRRKANVYGELADPTCAYWRDLTHCEMDLISKLLHPNPVKRGPLKTLNESHPYFTDGPFAFIAF